MCLNDFERGCPELLCVHVCAPIFFHTYVQVNAILSFVTPLSIHIKL
jgi:hypothetical protein